MKLEVKNIHKSFGPKQVLEGIDFATESGKALGVLGRNGAGKTTCIRIVMGVFPADEGQVLIDGLPINRKKMQIGYLPEEHGLYPKKPITEQLIYLAALRGMGKTEAKASIAYWLGRLGMQEYANKKLDTLSKGNQQKIQLVATLINNPDIIILDEPFSGLDPVNAALLKDIVKEQIKLGKIVLFSSHQMNYVEEFCDDIAILHNGNIVLSGAISDIKRSYERNVLYIRGTDLAAVQAFCKEKLASIVKQAKISKDMLMVLLNKPEHKKELMEALSSQDLDIDAIGIYEPSLNDIFVEYTGHDDETVKEDAAI